MPPEEAPVDGAVELPPVEAAGWDAGALLGDAAPPLVHAAATIATIANGAATRKNECFLVNVSLL